MNELKIVYLLFIIIIIAKEFILLMRSYLYLQISIGNVF